jgi:hypothetical protein
MFFCATEIFLFFPSCRWCHLRCHFLCHSLGCNDCLVITYHGVNWRNIYHWFMWWTTIIVSLFGYNNIQHGQTNNMKLGAIILDTCSSDSYALNQSLEFIRASINTVEGSAFQCTDGSTPRPKYGMKIISGVVGGSYSEVSLQVANLLRLFRIPQVCTSFQAKLYMITALAEEVRN